MEKLVAIFFYSSADYQKVFFAEFAETRSELKNFQGSFFACFEYNF